MHRSFEAGTIKGIDYDHWFFFKEPTLEFSAFYFLEVKQIIKILEAKQEFSIAEALEQPSEVRARVIVVTMSYDNPSPKITFTLEEETVVLDTMKKEETNTQKMKDLEEPKHPDRYTWMKEIASVMMSDANKMVIHLLSSTKKA